MGQIWPIITIWEGLFFPVCPPRVILYHIKERNNIYLLGSVKASKMQIMNAGAIDRSWDWGKIIKAIPLDKLLKVIASKDRSNKRLIFNQVINAFCHRPLLPPRHQSATTSVGLQYSNRGLQLKIVKDTGLL